MRRCAKTGLMFFSLLAVVCMTGCGSGQSAPVTATTAMPEEAPTEAVTETETVVEEAARNMMLNHFEGNLEVREEGDSLTGDAVYDGMKLVSGDSLETALKSFAWVGLDAVKELKMDENSVSTIQKNGNNLVIKLDEGCMFFHVSESLASDESLKIETTNMNISIRGTTGIIEKVSDYETMVVLLEGELAVYGAKGRSVSLHTGQCADVIGENSNHGSDYGKGIFVRNIYQEDIPEFVREELADREDIQQKIMENEGDAAPETNPFIPAIIAMMKDKVMPDGRKIDEFYGKTPYSFAILDADGDGEDELVAYGMLSGIYGYDKDTGTVVREDNFPKDANISQVYEGGMVEAGLMDDDDGMNIIARYDPEKKEYDIVAKLSLQDYDKATEDGSTLIECDELDLHGKDYSVDEFRRVKNYYLKNEVQTQYMGFLENDIMRLRNISRYKENISVRDGEYHVADKYITIVGSYNPYGDLIGVSGVNTFGLEDSFEYIAPDGTKEKLSKRVLNFIVDKNTVYHKLPSDWTVDQLVGEMSWGYSGLEAKVTIIVKDGVCTDVTIRER